MEGGILVPSELGRPPATNGLLNASSKEMTLTLPNPFTVLRVWLLCLTMLSNDCESALRGSFTHSKLSGNSLCVGLVDFTPTGKNMLQLGTV